MPMPLGPAGSESRETKSRNSSTDMHRKDLHDEAEWMATTGYLTRELPARRGVWVWTRYHRV